MRRVGLTLSMMVAAILGLGPSGVSAWAGDLPARPVDGSPLEVGDEPDLAHRIELRLWLVESMVQGGFPRAEAESRVAGLHWREWHEATARSADLFPGRGIGTSMTIFLLVVAGILFLDMLNDDVGLAKAGDKDQTMTAIGPLPWADSSPF